MKWFIIPTLLLPATVHAQDAPDTAAVSAGSDAGTMGVNLRYRYMFLPSAILNNWYFDSDDPGALPYDRTKLSTHVIGFEFAIEPAPASFLIYGEYWKVNMTEGYWDDIEDPAIHTDGDWLRPQNLGGAALGFDFGHEFPVSDAAQDVWLGFRVGSGLGVLIPTGRIETWHAGRDLSTDPTNNCMPMALAPDRQASCDPDETLNLWPVYPIIDMDLAWRLHLGPNLIWRLDAGLHDLVYFGTGFGTVW